MTDESFLGTFNTKNSIFENINYLLLFYFIMVVAIFPEGKDKGHVIAHILFLKTPALMIYPSYSELMDFCDGFMIADLPWFN